jgi:hypothetical protein
MKNKPRNTKKVKQYRILRADGLWWSITADGWVRNTKEAAKMTKQHAKEILDEEMFASNADPCAMIEVGTKPDRRKLFRPSFLKELDALCKRYGTTSMETTYDTLYIGGWD